MTTPTLPVPGDRLRGVNLGGWLLLEKWITPSLFAGLAATDETTYCAELGLDEATRRLHHHWQTFITRDDFAWLARTGINAVRLPVGHWLFGPDYPYHRSYGSARHPFVVGGLEIAGPGVRVGRRVRVAGGARPARRPGLPERL